jgi:hypothetical protein
MTTLMIQGKIESYQQRNVWDNIIYTFPTPIRIVRGLARL